MERCFAVERPRAWADARWLSNNASGRCLGMRADYEVDLASSFHIVGAAESVI